MRIFFVITLLLSCFVLPSSAKSLSVGEEKTYELSTYLSYYNDDSYTMTIDELKNKEFLQLSLNQYAFPISSDAHWFRVTLKNDTSNKQSYYLEYDQSYVHEIDFYLFKDSQEVSSYQTGALRPKSSRAVDYHRYLFPIELNAGEEVEIYVRLHHVSTAVPLAFKLEKEKTYFIDKYSEILLQGLFFGVMIVMFFYNMILYIMTKYRAYIAYIFYLGTITLFLSISHGFGFYFFEITSRTFYSIILYSVSMLYTVFIIWFMMEVLALKTVLPKTFTFLKGLNYIFVLSWAAVTILLLLGLQQYIPIPMKVFMPTFLVMNIFIFIMLIFLAVKKNRAATLILVPWMLIIASLVLMILTILSVIPAYDWTKLAMQGAIVLEAVMFSLVLGERYRQQNDMLIQQSRQAEMGSMIENIVHQWRQPLSGINADVFSIDTCMHNNDLSGIQKLLNRIEEKTLMMSDIINDFQNFYDPNKAKQTFKLKDVLQQALAFNTNRFKSDKIEYKMKIDSGLKSYGNKNEFLQVILAILGNAIDVLISSKEDSRKIRITGFKEGGYAVIKIQNNGENILPEHLPLLFEPHFTTKKSTQKSGIGLFMSRKIIVESFGGIIEIQNDNEGVCVTMKVKHV